MLGSIARKLVPGSAKAAAKRMLGIKKGGSPFEPMSPSDILADIKRYDASGSDAKDQISIALIERLTSRGLQKCCRCWNQIHRHA